MTTEQQKSLSNLKIFLIKECIRFLDYKYGVIIGGKDVPFVGQIDLIKIFHYCTNSENGVYLMIDEGKFKIHI